MQQPSWSDNTLWRLKLRAARWPRIESNGDSFAFTLLPLSAPTHLHRQFVLDVSNVFQLADSQFELAALLHNPALRSKPLLLLLNKMSVP